MIANTRYNAYFHVIAKKQAQRSSFGSKKAIFSFTLSCFICHAQFYIALHYILS